jgi:hypothetical protein
MSHESHGGGDLTVLEFARERIVALGNLIVDTFGIPICAIFGFLFMHLKMDPIIAQSGKMDGGGHGAGSH